MALPFLSRSHEAGIPSVSLRRILPDATFVGCRDLRVAGCSSDSRRIEPGQVFVARRGETYHGLDFAAMALERGAVAVIAEEPRPEAGPLQIIVANAPSAYARIAQALAGSPSGEFPVIGITGGAGKTAAALFLRAILEAAGRRVGMISSSGWSDGARQYPGPFATSPSGLAGMLAAMAERRCEAGVMAVSAETLHQRATDGICVKSALVTSVRGVTPRPNRQVLARLVRQVIPGGVVAVNGDDPDAAILSAVNLGAHPVTFGLGENFDISATIEECNLDGTRFRLRGFDREARIQLRPLGESVLMAALGAAAVARENGVVLDAVVAGLESVTQIPGRLERLARGAGRDVIADRAWDGRSLRAALRTIRERTEGQVLCVLGATADSSLAHEIAAVAEQESDRVFLTRASDASTGIDPEAWLAAMLRPGRVRILLDRRKAIEAALDLSHPGDAVLLSGISPSPWGSDAEVAIGWFQTRESAPARRSA
ncbi:MAG: UDP-N-acetylmuramyl-tripeptide synthetase [Planctomycetota bacterium]|nr:UDP-N-acetylmuramyl-tripeptide synthetase [Planctomycetota bacterium]